MAHKSRGSIGTRKHRKSGRTTYPPDVKFAIQIETQKSTKGFESELEKTIHELFQKNRRKKKRK